MKLPFFLFMALTFLSLISCNRNSNRVILWTDRPEFAFYTEFFNASQSRYRVEVRYFESPAQRLAAGGEFPDIVVASWLTSAATRNSFRSMDRLFSRGSLNSASFYPRLLSLGNINRRQLLLPVNFNIPAIIFAQDFAQSPSNPFVIGLNEIKERGASFNIENNGIFRRKGFSPSANDEFLFLTATLWGAGFREASPIAWNIQALEQSILWVQQWINDINLNIQAEDDFVDKFFSDPPYRLLNSGRILFYYMGSSDFFTLPEEHRANLDFRWIAAEERIPVYESLVFYGIHRRTRARRAAEAFTAWFFNIETQRLLLEKSRNTRMNEKSFGIAGGFSAMQTVTEQVFPHFYPGLLGHIPPDSFLHPANTLPRTWMPIKERVILPYLRERIRHSTREEVRPLERRIADWHRLNRE